MTEAPEGFTPTGFIAAVNEVYEKGIKENGFTQKKTFAPSQVGYGHGTCPRYWYMAFEGAYFENDIDLDGIVRMHHGTSSHGKIEEIIKQTSLKPEIEKEITNSNPPVRGFVDFIVNWNGERVAGEYKTSAQEAFIFRKLKQKGSPAHIVQVLIYLHVLGLDRGVLLYENKNTQELLALEIKMEDYKEYADEIIGWMNKVYQNYAYSTYMGDTLPARPFYSRKSKECKTCPVKRSCYDGLGKGDVNIAPLEVRT
jgi:CRISPR/Cas system-associated exonuclease Cas4 (RecB family)